MNIPNKIHYFWTGKNIPEKFMRNIIEMKTHNQGFEVHLWVINKSLMTRTFNNIIENIDSKFGVINVGELFGCEFDKIGGKEKIQKLNYKSNTFFIRDIDEAFDTVHKKLIHLHKNIIFLKSMFYRNINGYYHNYGMSSDIARSVILYLEGGIYLDVDVELEEASIKNISQEAKFRNVDAPLGVAFGDVRGKSWKVNSFGGTAILAANIGSKEIESILISMSERFSSNMLKRDDKYKNPTSIRKLKYFRECRNPCNEANEEERNDTWATSRVLCDFRFEVGMNTGPDTYKNHLYTIDRERRDKRPSKHFRFEKENENIFKRVDASAKWRRERKDRVILHDDTEFPSASNVTNNDIMLRFKKLKW
ncbi:MULTISPECIES: glycosyltransferase [Xenorhabdus]|uniref:glycosyltransferase n=1 Tax=Xenorhabdus TaxID=626 RepID=UPI000AE3F453|nr:glycosyltransferase [Xenorhabdus sp. NBAII XenSa04]